MKEKVKVWDQQGLKKTNRSIGAEAQAWEKFINDQVGLSL